MSEPHERLQEAREAAGYDDPTSAARAFGWNETTYRAHEAGGRGLKPAVAEKYARAFRVTASWLQYGEGKGIGAPLSVSSEVKPAGFKPIAIPVSGTVEAGTFREVITYDDGEPEYVFEESDPEFPRARMLAFDVAGNSMNQAEPPIMEGARLVCVDFDDTGLPPVDGMLVVVERARNDGESREWSVKEVEVLEDRTVLHPRSSEKRHKPIVIFDDPDAEGGVSAQIIALVRSVVYPVRSGRRRNLKRG